MCKKRLKKYKKFKNSLYLCARKQKNEYYLELENIFKERQNAYDGYTTY
jgi:hypothetical protein